MHQMASNFTPLYLHNRILRRNKTKKVNERQPSGFSPRLSSY